MKDEFGGRVTPPLVAGSLHGLRSFHVNSDGTLGAVSWPYTWVDGENIATCHERMRDHLTSTQQPLQSLFLAFHNPLKVPGHSVADCSEHGFYAYTDGSADFHHPYRVEGVIEGYGVVQEGTRGFRAEKGRIAGLVVPDPDPVVERNLWEKVKHFRDNMTMKKKVAMYLVYFVLWMVSFSSLGEHGVIADVFCALGMAAALAALWVAWGPTYHPLRGLEDRIFKNHNGISRKDAYRKIRETYKSAKFFETREEMLAHFNMKE